MSTSTLYRAAANAGFRSLVDGQAGVLPDAVEEIDMSALDEWTADIAAIDMLECATTCSKGPFTIVCDGTTK